MATSSTVAANGYGNAYMDALIEGHKWSGTVTYRWVSDSGSGFTWGDDERGAFLRAMQNYSDVCGLTFREDTGGGANITWRERPSTFFDGGNSTYASHAYPNANQISGNFNANHPSWTGFAQGSNAYVTIVHELGHGMGLQHPHEGGELFPGVESEGDTGDDGLNQGIWTMMSYNDGWDVDGPVPNTYGYQGTLMAFDIAALQRIYGANFSTRVGDDAYYAPTVNAAGTFWTCIWDAGGRDELNFASATAAASIDLRDAPLTGANAAGYVSRVSGIKGGFTIANGAVIENAIGGAFNDTINGNSASNRLVGNDGNDTIEGFEGFDTIDGGAGNDVLRGGAGIDFLMSGSGVDLLDGGDGEDYADYTNSDARVYVDLSLGKVLYGHAEDDTLVNIEGLIGSTFGDSLGGNSLSNLLNGGRGDDTLQGYGGSDFLIGGDGTDVLIGGDGSDNLDGGSGFDTASYEGDAAVSIDVAAGSYGGAAFGDTFVSIERVAGSSLADFIAGSGTSESFAGRGGADSLYGREGSDTLEGGAGGDTLDGGDGSDWVSYANSSAGVYVDFSFQGGKVLYGDAAGDTLVSLENIEGSNFDDTLVGGAAGDQIWGQGGGDRLSGNEGNDTLAGQFGDDSVQGGIGADYLDGGDGTDWADYRDSDAGVTIDISAGKVAGVGGTAEGDTLVDFENIYGSIHADRITGSDGANWLVGLDGNDALYGRGSSDTLDGGVGEDTLDGGSGDDLVQLVASGGDRVYGGGGVDSLVLSRAAGATDWSFDYGTGVGSDGFQAFGFSQINAFGGGASETITGAGGADSINGGGGADQLSGGLADDTLEGGAGADRMDGGAGTDLADYAGATASVWASLAGVAQTGDAAGDIFVAIEQLGGSAFSDRLTGNNLDNTLFGRDGDDTLVGSGGADRLDGGDGRDTADYRGSTAAVTVSLLSVLGIGGVAEGDRLVRVENLTGSAFADRLTGNVGSNVLDGAGGADIMTGGAGHDIYVVDVAADRVIENAGEGTDLVRSSISYRLGNDVEDLALIGTADLNGYGNAVDNALTGNAGANILDGEAGADTMSGGAGDDTYTVDDAGDRIIEAAGPGQDLVRSAVTYALAANVESLLLLGTSDLNATGNIFADTLTGNAGANLLNGGGGADAMAGRGGNDTYLVDTVGDVVVELAGQGTDVVRSSVSFVLSANVETLVLTGAGNISGTGNSLANAITGNAGGNVLAGGLGGDTLAGGAGRDSFLFDTALNGTTNVDTIVGFSVTDDVFRLDDAVFGALGGPGALAATAFHTGSAAADALDRIIYDSAAGDLFYDADGSGAAAQVRFADLASGLSITRADFLIV